jgi:hypothetical protein
MFKKLTLTLAFIALSTLATFLLCQYANAQEDAAPFAGKCFGEGTSTCLVPALSFNVTTVTLSGPNAGKLSAGAVPVGAGYSLQFAYDQWYTFGPAVHAIVDFSQANANFVQLAGMFNFARYIHAGVVWSMLGSERTWYAAGGLTVPIDVVTTAVAERKAKAVRAARMGAAQ